MKPIERLAVDPADLAALDRILRARTGQGLDELAAAQQAQARRRQAIQRVGWALLTAAVLLVLGLLACTGLQAG